MTEIQKEDIPLLLKTFFNEKGLVRQHLDSYNEFIDHGLQEVVDEVAEIPIEVPERPYKVKLGQIWVIDPQSRITGPYETDESLLPLIKEKVDLKQTALKLSIMQREN